MKKLLSALFALMLTASVAIGCQPAEDTGDEEPADAEEEEAAE
jgi:hypothetical protein